MTLIEVRRPTLSDAMLNPNGGGRAWSCHDLMCQTLLIPLLLGGVNVGAREEASEAKGGVGVGRTVVGI